MDDCIHPDFRATFAVARISDQEGGPVRHFVAEVTFACSACGLPFHFIGPSAGVSFTKPTVDVAGTTLHAPIAPGEAPIPSRITFEVPRPAGEAS